MCGTIDMMSSGPFHSVNVSEVGKVHLHVRKFIGNFADMIEKIQAIVLGRVRHSDRNEIVTLYTRSRGRMAVVSACGAGKRGRMRSASLQPLAVIEADMDIRPQQELQTLRRFGSATVWRNIYFHPVRSSIVLFMAEFLGRLCRECSPDAAMWDFIYGSVAILDTAPTAQLANHHIALLVSLLSFSGIMPDVATWAPGRWFDMRGGVYCDFPPAHGDRLMPEDAAVSVKLLRMDFLNARRYRFSREQRRRITEALLRYYAVHFPGISGLRSLEILVEVFEA